MAIDKRFYTHLEELISYNSCLGKKQDSMPFGSEVCGALNCFLSIAKDMGFDTVNYDNYAGEISFGSGVEYGIIGHLDIVPAGIGWDTNPFKLTLKDGAYYGRGIVDDKGPLLMCLYALKQVRDSKIKFNSKIRIFVGCNEETGWKDVEYLKSKTTLPECGFSPDGDFPVCYAEKGIYIASFTIPLLKNFDIIDSGSAINCVCAHALARVKEEFYERVDKAHFNTLLKKHGLTMEKGVIQSHGVTAHGSSPHLGKNALNPLFQFFCDCGENVQQVVDCLLCDKYNIFSITTPQGNLTFSPNLIKQTNKGIVIKCDCRLPYPLTRKHLNNQFQRFNIPFTLKQKHPTFCADKNGKLVKSLISAYNQVMGENATPIAMGGSTFARAFKVGCAFGPSMQGFGGAHVANEYATIQALNTAYEIYVKAIENLVK